MNHVDARTKSKSTRLAEEVNGWMGEIERKGERDRESGDQEGEKNDTTNREIFEISGSMKACRWYVFDIKQNTKPKPFLPAPFPLCFFFYHEKRRGKKWAAVKFNRCNHILWIFSSPQFWLFSSGWKVEERTKKYIRQFGIYSFVQSLVNRFWIMPDTAWAGASFLHEPTKNHKYLCYLQLGITRVYFIISSL